MDDSEEHHKGNKRRKRRVQINANDQLHRWQEYLRELFQNEILDGVDQSTDEEDEDVIEDNRISSNPPTNQR
ncbi:hypothetical protein HHI36_017849 [Cryptolaemus montrouzieri]|uniref:Uncharacterized protein n=1 Tax=Cryptolaemus montrouzieri TaxID=559131 RepID=A0ABD2NP29_9CUCU